MQLFSKMNKPENAAPPTGKTRAGALPAFGLHLTNGRQDATLADPDALRTVMAEPDLETAKAAFGQAMERAAALVPALDFTNETAAHSSLATLLSLLDQAWRTADRAVTQQYESEMAMLDRREASWNGVKLQYEHELALLEKELAEIETPLA